MTFGRLLFYFSPGFLMDDKSCLIKNGDVFIDGHFVSQNIIIENGKIVRLFAPGTAPKKDFVVIDASGKFVLPGLVDLHVHGAGGSDLLEDRSDALPDVARHLARFGTTAFLATTLIMHEDKGQPHIRHIVESPTKHEKAARVLGIHIEGPFVNPDKRGMIQPISIREPSPAALGSILKLCQGKLKMMTIAPELDGVIPLLRDLASQGVIAALGHTDATYAEVRTGVENGITHVTHVANAMRGLHHREPGALGAAIMDERLSVQIIGDCVHIHPQIFEFIVRSKAPGMYALITDGIRATGLAPGDYEHGVISFVVEDGVARAKDGTLVGTALTQLQMIQRLREQTQIPFAELVRMATIYPAQILNIADQKGSIGEGKDADIVICNQDLEPVRVFVEGQSV